MNPNKLALDYDSWHSQVQAWFDPDCPLQFPWYKSAFGHINQNAKGNLLEIGCGRGEFAIWLSGVLPEINIIAVDVSEVAIEIAVKHAKQKNARVELLRGDAQSLSFPDDYFDYVVSCECLEHVPRPLQMVSELRRVLKPGGQFCLTTENYFNGMLLAWAKSWISGQPFNSGSGVQPHENFFFFWHVQTYLSSSGLIVDKTESCHYQWLLLPRVNPSKLCTVQFSHELARFLAKPFGRHFSFFGRKPSRQTAPK